MTIRSVASAWCSLCFALLFAPLQGASAATLTFTDANCADFSISQSSPGSFQVTCNLLTTPACQLSANTLNPSIGTTLTLTASCNRTPTSWTFSGGNAAGCAATQATCNDSQSATGPVTYNVVAANGAGSGPAASLTVNWQAAAPLTAPTGCTLTSTPSSLPTGGGATVLSVSCSGGGAPTNFGWTGGALAPDTTASTQSANITTTTVFSVTPRNGAGNGNSASTTVSVAGTTGTNGTDFCSNYSQVTFIDVPWGGQAISGGGAGSFFKNGVLVARFTVPAGYGSAFGSKGRIEYAEYVDSSTYRQASLSSKACDFRGVATNTSERYKSDLTNATYPLIWAASNTSAAYFTVTGTALATPQLVAGQTYYLNLRNYSPYLNGGAGGNSCGSTTCNAIVRITTP
jgi:hypothetical protein